MTAAFVWTVDGLRVPVSDPDPTVRRNPPRRLETNRATSRAILEAQAAASDLTIPDLTPFGATLTPAQADQYRQWATRRRDRWTGIG